MIKDDEHMLARVKRLQRSKRRAAPNRIRYDVRREFEDQLRVRGGPRGRDGLWERVEWAQAYDTRVSRSVADN